MNNTALVSELQTIRRDLAELAARVLAIESQLASGPGDQRFTTPPQSPLVVNYAGGGLTSPILPPFPAPSSSAGTPAATSSVGDIVTVLDGERRRFAEEAGAFIRRALEGNHRGTSGRERLRLSSRYYILIRDFEGHTFNPIQLHKAWSTIKPLVKRGTDCGGSIFIGWHTTEEARICTEAAGLIWPADG